MRAGVDCCHRAVTAIAAFAQPRGVPAVPPRLPDLPDRGMSAATLAEKVTEGHPVRRWRLQELIRAGYDPCDALALSGQSEIDLHAAIDLVKRGCPPRTAARILL